MGTIEWQRIQVFQSTHNSDLYTNCVEEWCPHQRILYVATTESLVVCFFVYGLILPIYNGRETVVPPPRRNVNLPKDFGQESSGSANERHTADRVDSSTSQCKLAL